MVYSNDYIIQIRSRNSSRSLRDAGKEAPGVFLLRAAFGRALRSQHRLRNGAPSTVVVIVDTKEIGDNHRKAAKLARTGPVEPWPHLLRRSKADVYALDPPSIAAHVNAARRRSGRSHLAELTVAAIDSLEFSVMVPLACKPQVSLDVVRRQVLASGACLGAFRESTEQ